MHVRRLNSAGVKKFRAFLDDSRRTDSPIEVPLDILTSPTTSSGLNVAIAIEEDRTFNSKMDLAEYLYSLLSLLNTGDTLSRKGMWSWLGLYMFETLCPISASSGLRQIRKDWYYVFQPDDAPPDYTTYYRHLLYTPYSLYRSFQGTVGRALLTSSVSTGGDVIEQIASRQEYISCRPVLGALDHLYYDEAQGQLKRGATGNRDGNLRRFVAFLQQIDTTHDLYGMEWAKIIALLPPEFDEWRE